MNTATLERARAAVASHHWRWMPGMLVVSTNNYHRPARVESLDGDTYGLTVVPHADGPVFAAHHEYGIAGEFPRGSSVPDLDDPVTVEAVGILAREAWGADAIDVRTEIAPRMGGAGVWWTARTLRGYRIGSGSVRRVEVDPRVACYVAALLAAPPPEVGR